MKIVFITKYALSKGIYTEEVEQSKFKYTVIHTNGWVHQLFDKPDWHEIKEEAIEQAERMRTKKIKSLKAQIDKLEKLKF